MTNLPKQWLTSKDVEGENLFKFYDTTSMAEAFALADSIKGIILASDYVENVQVSLHTFNVMVSLNDVDTSNRADIIALAHEIETAINR